MFAVVRQLIDRLVHIGQCRVALLFLEAFVNLGLPAAGEFLERAHIQVAVVKVRLQLGHVLDQKAPVLADGVAAQGRGAFGHVLFQEIQDLLLGVGFARGRCLDLVDQAAFAVRALVPGVHLVQQFIALVDHQHRALDAGRQVRAGHDHGDLQQAFLFRVEAGHLAIDPDQVLVRLGQGFRGRGGIDFRHAGIVADGGLSTIRSMNPSLTLTLLLAAGLLVHVALKLWLNARQVRHVAKHRDAVPAAYAHTITLPDHQKAADYTLAKARLAQWDILLDAVLLLGWTLLGGLDVLNQWLLTFMQPGLSQQLALVVGFVLIGGLIGLPLSLMQTFGVEQRFGFNKMTPALWISDLLKGVLLGTVLGLPLLALVLWLMDVGGTLWWLWAWGALVVWQLFLMAIAPNVIMPLFNKFTPLEDESLKARVQALMQRAGFQAKGFFVMDGSRRSAHSNAFFTGFGASKRVVFFDTLLKQLSPAEMEAVLAHELGHFKHRHIVKMMAVSFATTLAGLALLGWLAQQAWFYTGLGVVPNMNGSNSALALVLFMLVVPVFSFFLAPLSSWRSRVQEFEADAYAASQTPAADLASALLKLYQDNASTLTPDPLFVKFYYSHPPASERLARMRGLAGAH